jgi:cytochrome o ubiquinol oxidase subunit 2
MLFDVHVVSQLAFPDWVSSTAGSDQVLERGQLQKTGAADDRACKPTYRLDDPTCSRPLRPRRFPPYLWREWITSVDHKRIGVMYIAARRW